MASLRAVGDALRRVLNTIDQSIAAHHEAADLAEQARELLGVTGSGSNSTDVEQACEWFTKAVEGINEPEGQVSMLATAAEEIRSYLRRNGIPHEAYDEPAPPRSAGEQVEALRRQLPPPVQPGGGQKTHRRWFAAGSDEARAVVSGEDAESAEVWQTLQEMQFPEKGPPINYTPCRMKWGCDNLLPVLLPEGCTLTVYGPNYRKTFTGGKRPPWQR